MYLHFYFEMVLFHNCHHLHNKLLYYCQDAQVLMHLRKERNRLVKGIDIIFLSFYVVFFSPLTSKHGESEV